MVLKKMTVDDLTRVHELEIRLFPNPWPRSFFESDLGRPDCVALIAEENGSLIAYGLATCCDVEMHVTNIAVDQRCQRRGIATQLMNELEKLAREKGCAGAYLEVRTGNAPAIELYRKLGYTVAYRRRQYYIDGDDAYVMEKKPL